MDARPVIPPAAQPHPSRSYAADPFFDVLAEPSIPANPFSFFEPDADTSAGLKVQPPPAPLTAPIAPVLDGQIVHQKVAGSSTARRLESFETRTLVMGLIRLLQRRGIIGQDELQRLITNLLESGELEESRGRSDFR
jgi:hypothetical protein